MTTRAAAATRAAARSPAAPLRESQIQDAVRLVLGAEPDAVWWRNNIGRAQLHGHTIAFGVGGPGGADLLGVFRGIFTAVEIKSADGRQTEEQRRFEQLVRRKGGIYVVLRSADDAHAWLAELRRTVPPRPGEP